MKPITTFLFLLVPSFTTCSSLLNNQLQLTPVVDNTHCEQIANPLLNSLTFPAHYQSISPAIRSVRPNSTSGTSVVLEVELTNAPSLLAVGTDLLITWTADVSTFASKRFTVLTSPTEDTFTVLLDFQHNNTAASIPPLWHRVTYFYLRLILPSSASQSSSVSLLQVQIFNTLVGLRRAVPENI